MVTIMSETDLVFYLNALDYGFSWLMTIIGLGLFFYFAPIYLWNSLMYTVNIIRGIVEHVKKTWKR